LLGHAKLADTTVYLHLSRRHLQAVASPLESLVVSTSSEAKHSRRRVKDDSAHLEVADILRACGSNFLERHGSHLASQHRKVMDAIVRCRTAALVVIAIGAPAADIRPSPITRAATGTVPSARATHAPGGWPRVPPNCCPCPTSTSSSRCPMSCLRSCCRTSGCSYDLLFRASAATLLEVACDPKHLGAEIGLLSVLHTWGQNCSIIPMSTVWCRAVV